LSHLIVGARLPVKIRPGTEYVSHFLVVNYGLFTMFLFFGAGLAVGYFWRLSAWVSGLCMIAVFPLTAIVEAVIDATSHNLIPFEFIMHFMFALPAVIGVYLGRLVWSKTRTSYTNEVTHPRD
jgi:hypothetical protein